MVTVRRVDWTRDGEALGALDTSFSTDRVYEVEAAGDRLCQVGGGEVALFFAREVVE